MLEAFVRFLQAAPRRVFSLSSRDCAVTRFFDEVWHPSGSPHLVSVGGHGDDDVIVVVVCRPRGLCFVGGFHGVRLSQLGKKFTARDLVNILEAARATQVPIPDWVDAVGRFLAQKLRRVCQREGGRV